MKNHPFSLPSAWGWATFAYVALKGRKLPDRRSPYTTGFFTVSLNFPLIHHNMSNFIHKWCIIAVTTFINQHKQVMGELWYRKFHLSCFGCDGNFVGHSCIIFCCKLVQLWSPFLPVRVACTAACTLVLLLYCWSWKVHRNIGLCSTGDEFISTPKQTQDLVIMHELKVTVSN